MKPHTKKQEAL